MPTFHPRRSILVAEDNPFSRDLLLHQLNMLGHDAVADDDGASALAAWREGDFALLITDLQMPGMDGYALAEALRNECVEVRPFIVVLTASHEALDEARAAAAAFDAVLIKPAGVAELRSVLGRFLDASRR